MRTTKRSNVLLAAVGLAVLICSSSCMAKEGIVKAVASDAVKCDVTFLEDFNFKAGGWSISGKWQKDKPLLDIQCRNSGKADAVLSLTFPAMGRDEVKRFTLSGKKAEYNFSYSPPWTGKGNPYNRYVLKIRLKTKDKELTQNIVLTGKDSDVTRLGAPLNTKYIKKSIVGTNEHINFSHGRNRPPWGDWADYKTLIDLMADAGIKWIRGAVGYGKDEQGKYNVEPWTLEWMGYAKEKNISLIGCFNLNPNHDPEEVRKKCRAIAEGYKGLINVFEIGNEPENFTGWRKERNYVGKPGKYDGSWNGKAKDGSTAEWVKEYVKMTNIAADAIRKARPGATIVGLGSSPPVNHRMLELGISKAVDGIVEHPYSYYMPPEKIPYGLPYAKRDGVRVGDENFSFLAIMNSMLDYSKETGKERTMWITEFGPTSYWHGEKHHILYAGYTEKAQAAYLVRRFMLCMTLPEIKVACQYIFLDDYGSDPWRNGANFGLLRADYSPKPSYYAVQRLTSLFNGFEPDTRATITVEKSPLHRSMKRTIIVDSIKADNSVYAYGFCNPGVPNERQLAVWSGLPVSGEFNSRFVSIKIKGWKEFGNLVAVDLITGKTFDVPVKIDGDDLIIDLILTDNPLVIKMFRTISQ